MTKAGGQAPKYSAVAIQRTDAAFEDVMGLAPIAHHCRGQQQPGRSSSGGEASLAAVLAGAVAIVAQARRLAPARTSSGGNGIAGSEAPG